MNFPLSQDQLKAFPFIAIVLAVMADLTNIGEWVRWVAIGLALVALIKAHGVGFKIAAVIAILVALAKYLFLGYLNLVFGSY